MIARDILGLAAEFAVASELCRRNFYAQLTLGNKKRTDLLIHDPEADKFLRIEVKAKQGRDWPNCKGIYGNNVILIFVDYMQKEENQRPDFFLLTVEDWKELVVEHATGMCNKWPERYGTYGVDVFLDKYNVSVWRKQLMKSGKPYEGTGVTVGMIEKHREAWCKIKAAPSLAVEEPDASEQIEA